MVTSFAKILLIITAPIQNVLKEKQGLDENRWIVEIYKVKLELDKLWVSR